MTIPEQLAQEVEKAHVTLFDKLKTFFTGNTPGATTATPATPAPAVVTTPAAVAVVPPVAVVAPVIAPPTAPAAVEDPAIASLRAELATANGTIVTLRSAEQDIAKRANSQFIAHCRKQGIPAGTIPDQNDTNASGGKTATIHEQYNALSTPRERAEFYAAHTEELIGK